MTTPNAEVLNLRAELRILRSLVIALVRTHGYADPTGEERLGTPHAGQMHVTVRPDGTETAWGITIKSELDRVDTGAIKLVNAHGHVVTVGADRQHREDVTAPDRAWLQALLEVAVWRYGGLNIDGEAADERYNQLRAGSPPQFITGRGTIGQTRYIRVHEPSAAPVKTTAGLPLEVDTRELHKGVVSVRNVVTGETKAFAAARPVPPLAPGEIRPIEELLTTEERASAAGQAIRADVRDIIARHAVGELRELAEYLSTQLRAFEDDVTGGSGS